MTVEIIGFLRPVKKGRHDPIAKIALDMANAIRLRHGAKPIGNPSNMACYMGLDAYRTMRDRHDRENPEPPTPPAFRKLMDEMAALPFDPNDPRLVRLRAEVQKRLPKKLKGKELAPW